MLQKQLDALTAPGELYEVVDAEAGTLRCVACAHRCLLKAGRRGVCQVRFNESGELRVPFGYVSALNADPIEKKPFYHVLPGTVALSFGMLGCDFHCPYCQNWSISQTLRDQHAGRAPDPISADELVRLAMHYRASAIASTYNEPLITAEWAAAIFKKARAKGMRTLYVSNGNATPEALDYIAPWLDAYKIDLKTMQDKQYRRLGGVLQHVLDTIEGAHARGLWVEVVTLIVPGFNDSSEELWDLARYVASVSPDIPWHVTAFHPDYKMTAPGHTPADTLDRAAEIGVEAGLRFVYAGNLPGRTRDWENTRCPQCNATLITRFGFQVRKNVLKGGRCPNCGAVIPGIWTS
ncbi:MAG: AmmeMemoRadiSam system radical SAM enzyme [Anaerolineae bacterium]|nr:AmmeMemoRadiSam system radical SAM enzyme [Anaerolineae bacterium]